MRLPFTLLIALAAPAAGQSTAPVTTGGTYVQPIGQPPVQTMTVEPAAMMLAAFDADGDARTTRAEAQAGLARSFAAIDAASAGSIGYIGFSDWAERWLGDRNALPSPFETDADHDNRITLAELTTKMDTIFDRLDRDRDGVLTRAECLTIRANAGGWDRDRRKRR